ncbi:DsbA family protein [Microlunatus sp. Gsoil 973]|uniref:DsbA family protein n=1 Tax=Microlunatus sp. Gsoil 973 TaxID=2672569 RepID=UPI0012B4A1B8|nr:DsbA family protein [Microlunatus sp. Gsoil 973]QGN31706.1 disulfide bond formation protein DsbA [Microlunatus sp. Gsoil 973]
MLIEVYADVTDVWAYVARRRLRRALDRVAAGENVPTVVWRPFLIDPTAPSPSEELLPGDEVIDGILQQTEPGVGAAIRRLEAGQAAEDEGLAVPGQRWRASSWAAHRMITAALDRGPGLQDQVVDTVLSAQFEDGADINSMGFLEFLADRFELPGPVRLEGTDAALAYLQPGFPPDDPLERRTREAQLFGQALGVTRSPTFLIDQTIVETGAASAEVLATRIAEFTDRPSDTVPDEVRRVRAAQALLAARNPRGSLYLLAPLRPEYDGDRGFETLVARALAASASLEPARAKLAELLERYPDDAYLQLLMGKTLKRLGHPDAEKHLALATAMHPEYLDF